jgi:uncharacterized SAM-binding protein YcdF (DUF218 family)
MYLAFVSKNLCRYRWRYLLLLLIGVVLYLGLALWLAGQINRDNKVKSAVVVVLGARTFYNQRPNPCLLARVRHGVALVKAGDAPFIIFSGGTDREDGRNEAQYMRQWALGLGLAAGQIFIEPHSTSTHENLLFSQKIMSEQQFGSVIIVTEPFHSPRAGLLAGKLGLNYSLSPAADSPCWQRWGFGGAFFWREPLAMIENWLSGEL